MTDKQQTPTECAVCHRKAKIEEMTTATFLVASKEETRFAHQRCIDREHASFERWARKHGGVNQ
jgi:hypothetical protein